MKKLQKLREELRELEEKRQYHENVLRNAPQNPFSFIRALSSILKIMLDHKIEWLKEEIENLRKAEEE